MRVNAGVLLVRGSALILALVGLLQTGCFSSDPKREYFYQLKGPLTAQEKGDGPRLMVATFDAAAGYETPRLAYRSSEFEVGYYGYHKWTTEPARLITEMTTQFLRASGKFSAVGDSESLREPQAVLEGTVLAIEEVDHSETWQARLALRWQVRRTGEEKALVTHIFDRRVPCTERHPREVARGISQILAEEAKKLADKVARAMK